MNEPFDPVVQDATVYPWTVRAEVTRLTAWGVAGTTLLGLVVRLALGPLPAWFIILTLVLVAATVCVPAVLKRGGSPQVSAVVVLARYGGEEFIALLPGSHLEQAQRVGVATATGRNRSEVTV